MEFISDYWLYILLAILVIILVLVICLSSKKRKKLQQNGKITREHREPVNTVYNGATLQISFLNQGSVNDEGNICVSLPDGTNKLFGRHSDANVTGLNGDSSISSIHFKLTNSHGILYINDMASGSGVSVNSQKISARTQLSNGDLLQIGNNSYIIHIN